jgi:hypothetical protein
VAGDSPPSRLCRAAGMGLTARFLAWACDHIGHAGAQLQLRCLSSCNGCRWPRLFLFHYNRNRCDPRELGHLCPRYQLRTRPFVASGGCLHVFLCRMALHPASISYLSRGPRRSWLVRCSQALVLSEVIS